MSILKTKMKSLANCIGHNYKFSYYKPCVYKICSRNTTTTKVSKIQTISLIENKENTKFDLNFEDAKTAYKSKSNLELLRAYMVFQLCSIDYLVDNQKILLNASRKMLGKNLFKTLMKQTFYGHFVAGEDQYEIRTNVEKMLKYGVNSMLNYSAEEDLKSENPIKFEELNSCNSGQSMRKIFNSSEYAYELNTKRFMDSIDAASIITPDTALTAIKLTSLIRPQLLLNLSLLVPLIKEKKAYDGLFAWKNLTTQNLEFLNKFNPNIKLSESELGEIKNMFLRINDIAEHAFNKNVKLFIDAEHTYFQTAIRNLAIELMKHFNKNRLAILSTYQNYLKNAHDSVKADIELSVKEKFHFGAKLVRGAYMEQERERARQIGYEDPINKNFQATTDMYEKNVIYCFNQIKKQPQGSVQIMIASHNENTVRFAVQKMQEFNIKPESHNVFFGQLFGMCDFISFILGGSGYLVYKNVPYGPVEEVLPYLSRRANENRGIFDKVNKEKRLLASEIKRRLFN